jgi:hypothetical protein
MSVQVIHQQTLKARKDHYDDGWEYVHEWILGGCNLPMGKKMTFSEMRLVVGYRKGELIGNKILKGQLYRRQFNCMDGQTYTFKLKEDFYNLAVKYDLFTGD